jgi:hypothetical protein
MFTRLFQPGPHDRPAGREVRAGATSFAVKARILTVAPGRRAAARMTPRRFVAVAAHRAAITNLPARRGNRGGCGRSVGWTQRRFSSNSSLGARFASDARCA